MTVPPFQVSIGEGGEIASSNTETGPQVRRVRYSGRYPRRFEDKYKELAGDVATISKVISKGGTPAGQHIPIMLNSCLEHLGLTDESIGVSPSKLVVDCTLGYGGHSKAILENLLKRNDRSKLLSLDQDPIESQKAEERLQEVIRMNGGPPNTLRVANINFRDLLKYLREHQLEGKVSALLCDLGISSMQIDDPRRGFSFKTDSPLDMRMDPVNNNQTALALLSTIKPAALAKLFQDNSDEVYAEPIARALLLGNIPSTTIAFRNRIRECLESILLKKDCSKELVDATTRRCMQALRIEVNQEFAALDELLDTLDQILAPGGRAVFLTFHSGEDRRVKKKIKAGFLTGKYSSWSREVQRADWAEQRSNPRSACCKLRWCIRSEEV